MIISGTGHRELIHNEKEIHKITCKALEKANCSLVLSGMAQGYDTILAEAAIESQIPFKAICPFKKQADTWPEKAKKRYNVLMEKALEIIYTAEEYSKFCFFVRDRYLVDNSDLIFAYYDGRKTGGTYYTYKYAHEIKEKKRPEYKILNLFDIMQKLS